MITSVSPAAAAVLAAAAGLQPHREDGFRYRGRPVDAVGVELFLAGAYDIRMDSDRDGAAVLVAGQALALQAELGHRLGQAWAALNDPDPGMLNPGKYARRVLESLT